MGAMVSQITSLTIVCSTVYSRRRSKKASKLRVTGFCAGNSPVTGEFPHKAPVARKIFPFDDVITSEVCSRQQCQLQGSSWVFNVCKASPSRCAEWPLDQHNAYAKVPRAIHWCCVTRDWHSKPPRAYEVAGKPIVYTMIAFQAL